MKDKTIDPYRVERFKNLGCKHCGHGELWQIIDPDGNALRTGYKTESSAQEIADELNEAYDLGVQSVTKPKAPVAT